MSRRPAKLVLASASPRRKKLLEDAGFSLEIIVPDVEEISSGVGDPHEVAKINSIRKAEAVAAGLDEGIVVASDTIVALGGKIIGKPADEADAHRILEELSGTRHGVISGVAIIDASTGATVSATDETFVTMREITDDEISDYVGSGEAFGKAGAYAIQETADRFVEKLEGSFATVVGFPMEVFEDLLNGFVSRPR